MEPEVLGWEPLSNTWLASRTPQDAHVSQTWENVKFSDLSSVDFP